MKNFLKFILIAVPTLFLIGACTVETDPELEPSIDISDEPATGSLGAGEDFVLKTALAESTTLFGDDGYDFKLYSDDQTCILGGPPNIEREIDFFVKSATPLETKEYEGLGPFIRSASFFGCTVIITAVSDESISGKVKGGDPSGDQWVEGSFTATLCN